YVTTHELRKPTTDDQTQTGAAVFAVDCGVRLAESPEQTIHLLLCHSDSGILNNKPDKGIAVIVVLLNMDCDRSTVGKLARIDQSKQMLAGNIDLLEIRNQVRLLKFFGLFLQHFAVSDDCI